MFCYCLLMFLLLVSFVLFLQVVDVVLGCGLKEILDFEFNLLCGCYIVGGNIVVWFGVMMVLQWQVGNGNVLQGVLILGMDFRGGGSLKLSFQFSVYVIVLDVLLLDMQGCYIDSSGLVNVSGLVQSVQVVGDGNVVCNVIMLVVCNGVVLVLLGDGVYLISVQVVGFLVFVVFDGNQVCLLLQVDGQGLVQ